MEQNFLGLGLPCDEERVVKARLLASWCILVCWSVLILRWVQGFSLWFFFDRVYFFNWMASRDSFAGRNRFIVDMWLYIQHGAQVPSGLHTNRWDFRDGRAAFCCLGRQSSHHVWCLWYCIQCSSSFLEWLRWHWCVSHRATGASHPAQYRHLGWLLHNSVRRLKFVIARTSLLAEALIRLIL